MVVRLGFFSRKPSAKASSADFLRLEAIGSYVTLKFSHAPSRTFTESAAEVAFSIERLRIDFASVGLAFAYSVVSTWARSRFSMTLGWSARYLGRTIRWVVTKSPFGH